MEKCIVKKALNNNVLIAEHELYNEVVLIGKGIGFNRKAGDLLEPSLVEKMFILKDKREQEQYKQLLPQMDEAIFDTIVEAFEIIQKRTQSMLNEHIHVSLTDHLLFSVHRFMKGMSIKNPFLMETKTLYPMEFEVAQEVVDIVNQSLHINLPIDEVGFITLHIHSALTDKELSEVNRHSKLVSELIDIIEQELHLQIDKESIDYMRLIRHLRFAIERVKRGEMLGENPKIALLLQMEYPICYNLSWKLIKIMQNTLKRPVDNAEAVYLTMHLQRIQNKG
ncbi:transcription antiterminator [Caldibacillus lycopersici]|uniref:Transcription antiterminator n=1 Tax=Perspicuibacillus lycopersici TaxID=1325689 RepID=A0AAE3IW92_9BACI|nr:transcription antiterminator [Perspicuibacillus lycopersici]MCU9615347.1 transcription antiterminator [Perspicuibacillus lycopersici]